MEKAKKFFCQFDMFTAPALLRAKGQPQMSSFTIGVFSMALLSIFIYVFIDSSIKVINYDNISSIETQTVITSYQAHGYFQTFAVALDYTPFQLFEQLFLFQIQIVQPQGSPERLRMKPCQPYMWKKLGENYEAQFYNNQLGIMYCPNNTQPFFLNGTNDASYVWLTLSACKPAQNPKCNTSRIPQYFKNTSLIGNGAAFIWIYALDTAIRAQQKDAVSYYINSEAKAHLTANFGGAVSILFSSYQVQTDISILPFQNINIQKGIMIDLFHNYQTDIQSLSTDILGRVKFSISKGKKTIVRKVGKIDETLSYAGGLFSIVISFFAFFLSSFNQYRYELKVAQGVFNYDEHGKKIMQSDLNFFMYIKYTIYDWVQVLFCFQFGWKDCQQIHQTRQQVQSHMEVNRLFKRIQNLQTAVKHSVDENEMVCINLLEPPSLDKVKRQRLIMDYYDQLIKGKSAITVEDVKFINDVLVHASQEGLINSQTKMKYESKDGLSMEQINIQMKRQRQDRQNVVDIILENFPQIKKESEQIKLDQQMEQIQKQICNAFYKMPRQSRIILQQRIPILIIHRLRKRMDQINKTTPFNIQL